MVVKSIAYLFVFSFVGLRYLGETCEGGQVNLSNIHIRTLPLRIVTTFMLLNHWYNSYYWVLHYLSGMERDMVLR